MLYKERDLEKEYLGIKATEKDTITGAPLDDEGTLSSVVLDLDVQLSAYVMKKFTEFPDRMTITFIVLFSNSKETEKSSQILAAALKTWNIPYAVKIELLQCIISEGSVHFPSVYLLLVHDSFYKNLSPQDKVSLLQQFNKHQENFSLGGNYSRERMRQLLTHTGTFLKKEEILDQMVKEFTKEFPLKPGAEEGDLRECLWDVLEEYVYYLSLPPEEQKRLALAAAPEYWRRYCSGSAIGTDGEVFLQSTPSYFPAATQVITQPPAYSKTPKGELEERLEEDLEELVADSAFCSIL